MTIFRRTLSLLPLLFFVACDSGKVELIFDTKKTAPQHYRIESQMKLIIQSGATPEAVSSTLKAQVTSTLVVAYDDGSARFQMLVDSVAYRSDQRSVEECLHMERYLSQQNFQFKMKSNGDMQDLRMDGYVPELESSDIDLRRLLLKIQPVLPGTPIAMGDTWERQQVLNDESGKQAFAYKWFQVEDVFFHDGKKLAKLRMNVKYRLDDSTSVQEHLKADDFILGSGEVLFNVTDGLVNEVSLEISGYLNVLARVKNQTLPSMQVRQLIRMRRQL